MTVVRMGASGLSVDERTRLTEKLTDVACDETGRSREDLMVYVYDYRADQPRH